MIHWPRTRSYIYIRGLLLCPRVVPANSSFLLFCVERERESERKGAPVYNMKKKRPRADYSVKSVHLNSGLPFKTGVTVTFLLPLRSSTRRSVDSFCFVALFLSLSLSMCVYIQLSSSLYDNAHGTTWKSPIPWQFLVDSIRTIRLIRLIYALNT